MDHCSPLEILKRQKDLMRIAEGEGMVFVTGNRHDSRGYACLQ